VGINLRFINKKTKVFSFFVIVYIILLSINTPVVFADEPSTLVYINPANQNVTIDQNFNISINCVPGQYIKAFELKLAFDPSLIQANSVSKGDIFNGYTTFYNYGIINNSVGTIINVYGLIQGEGTVNNSGSLVSISFTAKSTSGVSLLNIYDLGVTNETAYVTKSLANGKVTINQPDITHTFSDATPSNNSAGISVSTSLLSININNTNGNSFYWEISTTPNIGISTGVNEYNGTKTCSISSLSYQTTYTWYVTCRDLISGKWTNVSYRFTTQNKPSGGGGGGGGGFIPPVEVNNPPNKPFTPSGPVIIENNTLYEYSSSTYDIDGDAISYKFDWGDGNSSTWSEYLPSNVTVSMSHSWESISIYEIKVMARDEQGLESPWSDSLVVMVLEKNNSENPPIVIINTSIDSNASNKTIVFDASKSYDTSGEIVNYTWDFGDGEIGYGIKVVHTYNYSGIYNVTLTVVDEEGYSYSSSITLNVYAGSENNEIDEKEEQTVFFNAQSLLIIFIIVILVFAVIFIVKYRDKIKNRIYIFWLLRIKK